MRCHVYRSSLREGLYVYVADAGADPGAAPAEGGAAPVDDAAVLAALPAHVRRQLGARAERAMTLELDEGRRLGQEDVREVLANLAERGFHVQMPRDIEPLVTAAADASVAAAARRAPRRKDD